MYSVPRLSVGFDKSWLGFEIPDREMTNPTLVFKFLRGISKMQAGF
jgi:hypothetical protein